MHEFSVIQSMVDIVTATALKNNAHHVKSVEIEIGKASGVVKEAMEFAWQSFTRESLLLNAQLRITEIPLQMKCHACGKVYLPDEIFEPCPECGETGSEVLKGRELRVIAIET